MKGLTRLAVVALSVLTLTGCASFTWPSFSGDGGSRVYHYEVRPGDTLYAISWRHGLDYREVARWNNLSSPDHIQVGQRLRLNPPSGSGGGTRPVASGSGQSGSEGGGGGTGTPPSSSSSGSSPAAGGSTGSGSSPAPAPSGGGDIDWQWPVEGELAKRFESGGGGKRGIEIRGREGADIRAAADGSVVYSGSALRGYGNLVIIKHDSQYLTAYGYNRRLHVSEGESVRKGQVIAEMGRGPGANSPGLHFELRRDGDPVDPLRHLPSRE